MAASALPEITISIRSQTHRVRSPRCLNSGNNTCTLHISSLKQRAVLKGRQKEPMLAATVPPHSLLPNSPLPSGSMDVAEEEDQIPVSKYTPLPREADLTSTPKRSFMLVDGSPESVAALFKRPRFSLSLALADSLSSTDSDSHRSSGSFPDDSLSSEAIDSQNLDPMARRDRDVSQPSPNPTTDGVPVQMSLLESLRSNCLPPQIALTTEGGPEDKSTTTEGSSVFEAVVEKQPHDPLQLLMTTDHEIQESTKRLQNLLFGNMGLSMLPLFNAPAKRDDISDEAASSHALFSRLFLGDVGPANEEKGKGKGRLVQPPASAILRFSPGLHDEDPFSDEDLSVEDQEKEGSYYDSFLIQLLQSARCRSRGGYNPSKGEGPSHITLDDLRRQGR